MKKVYYLKTCSTCIKILKALNLPSDFILQDVKTAPITVKQLEEIYALSGSYEAVFSRKSNLYKAMDLKHQTLTERDYKHYILEHYTFLKRPVIIINNNIFIGSAKEVVNAAKTALIEH